MYSEGVCENSDRLYGSVHEIPRINKRDKSFGKISEISKCSASNTAWTWMSDVFLTSSGGPRLHVVARLFFLHLSLLSAVKWKIRENPRQFIHLTSEGDTVTNAERKTPYHFRLILDVCVDLCLFKRSEFHLFLPSPKCEWQSAPHSAEAFL